MANPNDKNTTVGYKQPPKANQFKPGQSGNRRGRPKGSLNFSTILEKELSERVQVSENGRQKTMTKKQIIAKRLINKATEGDPKAVPIVLNETRLIDERNAQPESQGFVPLPEDLKIMQSIIDRIRNTNPDTSGGADVEPCAE